ncbi:MAG: lactate racemase domain-containing protein [Chloroflexota bacterium]
MKLLEQIKQLDFPAPIPETLLMIEQTFEAPKAVDVAATAQNALETGELLARMKPGATVAVGVGSRGIANIPIIVKAAIDRLKAEGMNPFIFPAMGSHGGATAEGQREVLANLGVTEESIGVEIKATMDVVKIGAVDGGPELFMDINAAQADHTLLIGRIKPHTDFRAKLESGLSKMAVIGLGKIRGATDMHSLGVPGFQQFLAPAAREYEANTNVVGGLAIIENAYDETAEIIGLTAAQIGTATEEALLERSKDLMPSLPFPEIDVLAVKQMGKDISGAGMDSNIISRLQIPRQPENFGKIDIAIVAVLALTEATHGNATGIGLADVTTARVANEIEWVSTYTNIITSGSLGVQRGTLPLVLPNDQQALQVALRCCGQPQATARIVLIKDTLHLGQLWVSPSLRDAVEAHARLSIVEEVPLSFTDDGTMTGPWRL